MRGIGFVIAIGAVAAAALGGPGRPAHAATATCTVTQAAQLIPYPLGITFGIPIAAGVAMGVEFDEAAGTFSLSRDAWYAQFGDTGAPFDTIGGVHGFVRMFPGSTAGTIDSNGQINLPDFPTESSTDFVDPPPDLPVTGLDLSTGAVVRSISIVSRATVGSALDFDTGEVVLAGIGFLTNAPGSGGTNMTGLRLACTLSPIPDRTKLPAGGALAKVRGRVKLQKGDFANGDKADRLALKATLLPGPRAFVLDGTQDLVLGVSVGGADVVTVFVAKGGLARKGKKLVVKRNDTCKVKKGAAEGVCKNDRATACETFADCAGEPALQVLSGRKEVGADRAQLGGTLALVPGKSGSARVVTKLQGLDLSALASVTDVSVAIGSESVGARVTTTGGKIK